MRNWVVKVILALTVAAIVVMTLIAIVALIALLVSGNPSPVMGAI